MTRLSRTPILDPSKQTIAPLSLFKQFSPFVDSSKSSHCDHRKWIGPSASSWRRHRIQVTRTKLVQSNYLNNSQIHSQIFHLNHFYLNNLPEPFSATPFSGSPFMDLPMWDLPPILLFFGFLISTFLFLWSPSSSWLGVTFSHLWILNLIFSFSTGDSGGCRQSTGLETQASPWTGRRFGSQVRFQLIPRWH